MDDPLLKRMAAKYHVANTTNRRKAIEEHRKTRMKLYQVKGKGQWDLYKLLKKPPATPLVAVRRRRKGVLAGRRIGALATLPSEIDSIIRQEYGDIYKGSGEKGRIRRLLPNTI